MQCNSSDKNREKDRIVHIDDEDLREKVLEGVAQADRGELVPGEDVFKALKKKLAHMRTEQS